MSWLWRQLRKPWTHYQISRSPDRRLLVRELMPAFAALGGEILWVGVRPYTRAYPAILARGGGVCSSLELDPRYARFGAPGRHVTGDLLAVDQLFGAGQFTSILCNGVFGFGVDGPEMQAQAFAAMAKVLKPGGWLLLGWNTDRTADPLATAPPGLEPAALGAIPARHAVPGTTHVYDLLRRSA